MGAVDFAADAHTLIALSTKQLVLGLSVVLADAEVEYGFFGEWLPLMFA